MRSPDAKRRSLPAIPDEGPQAMPNAWGAQLWGRRSAGVATGPGGCMERQARLYRAATCAGAQSTGRKALGPLVEETG